MIWDAVYCSILIGLRSSALYLDNFLGGSLTWDDMTWVKLLWIELRIIPVYCCYCCPETMSQVGWESNCLFQSPLTTGRGGTNDSGWVYLSEIYFCCVHLYLSPFNGLTRSPRVCYGLGLSINKWSRCHCRPYWVMQSPTTGSIASRVKNKREELSSKLRDRDERFYPIWRCIISTHNEDWKREHFAGGLSNS